MSWKERGRDQMMGNAFYPDEWLDSAYDIPYEQFYQKGMRGIIFDIDNTLVPHGAPADERAVQLFERLRAIGSTPVCSRIIRRRGSPRLPDR